MRFLVDAQLPIALARWLASLGHEAQHVHDLGLGAASDRAIWEEALRLGAVIITKDEDFVSPGRRPPLPQVVWIRFGNTTRATLLKRLALVFPQVGSALNAGESVIEVR